MKDSLHDITRKAVLQILAQGERPTWRRVRDIIGSGSAGDITRRVGDVMTELAERQVHGDYPEEVQAAFFEMWRTVKTINAREFEERQAQALERVSEANAARDGYRDQLHDCQRELTLKTNQLTELSTALHALRTAEAENQRAQRLLEEQLTRAETNLLEERVKREAAVALQQSEAARYQQIIAESAQASEARISGLETTLKSEQHRYNVDTAKLHVKVDEARQEAKQERKAHEKDSAASAKVIGTLREQLAHAKAGEAKLQGRLETLEAQLGKAQEKRSAAEDARASLNEQNNQLRTQLEAEATARQAAEKQLEGERQRAQALENSLKAAQAAERHHSRKPKD
ncbi:DNA-binding protein [Geopseudomonas aromaticivorans]